MTKDFSNFINAAKNFCLFIETETNLTEQEFLGMLQYHLLTLYSSARQIPSVDLQNEKDFDADIPADKMKDLLKFISDRVPFSYYWTVLNPVDSTNLAKTGTGDLVDDLSDTYEDLKSGLIIFDKGAIAAKENAIWKFKFDFDYHWGEHCIEALYAIHHYLADKR